MIFTQLNASHCQAYKKLMLMATQESPFSWITSHNEVRTLTEREMTEMLDHGQNESLINVGVLGTKKELIACLSLAFATQHRLAHKATLHGLYVLPEFRRQGIARELLTMCINSIMEKPEVIYLDVTVVTAAFAARQFYRATGFSSFALEPDAVKVGQHYYGLESLRMSVG
ncbi:MAG: GNAT family N-acetyltransferase [Methylococcaceae bacterium]|nr:GNAT family N-acetyltransferase [Methylococcaceae bacterium]